MFSLFYRGGKYTEDDAKAVLIQILNVVSFCHLQGVVHRDLKPEVGDFTKLTLLDGITFSLFNCDMYRSLSLVFGPGEDGCFFFPEVSGQAIERS